MKKKGDFNMGFYIKVILALAGFVILMFAFGSVAWGDTINDETCRASVNARSSQLASGVTDELKELVPFQCETKKICLSEDKNGGCDSLGKKITTVQVDDSQEKDLEIKQAIAREMANCWNIMGEGQAKIFSRDLIDGGVSKSKCVTCARIDFDNSITKDTENVNGMFEYLLTRKVPGLDEVYMEYLTNGGDVDDLQIAEDLKLNDIDTLDLGSQKAVVYVEAQKTLFGATIGAPLALFSVGSFGGSVGAAIGSVVGPIGTGVGYLIGAGSTAVVGAIVGGKIQTAISGGKGDYGSGVFVVDYDREDLKEILGCDEFENIS